MDLSQQILSDITVFNKYARHLPELNRRETWKEICNRNMRMHLAKYPQLTDEILQVYKDFVYTKKVLPSMRSLQFGGLPIELSNNRIFNCAYSAADDPAIFSETMFNLLSGSGCGYSVQNRHISKLPVVKGTTARTKKFLCCDDISGWADAVKALVKAYFCGRSEPIFDYRAIREKGSRLLTSGGKAPGAEPLRICLEHLRSIMNNARGRKLTSIEIHDMLCHIADSVLSGGIRRSAMIALFDKTDMEMLTCKSGNWWELNPQRGRANNSVVLKRGEVSKEEFDYIWKRVEESQAGEPGLFWTNDYDLGTNPCCEISLKSNQFCNLTTQNVSDVYTQSELNTRSRAAAFLGTLQAGYTEFPYLRDVWKQNTEEDALLGVSMSGIGSGAILSLNLEEASKIAAEENSRVAKLIGINPAKRVTAIKPEGTASLVLGCSSGVHAWYNDYYIRRMQVGKNEALYKYMVKKVPELVEDHHAKPHLDAVMSFPVKAPSGALYRTETAITTMERVKKFHSEWIRPGHNEGANTHNVSCTISVRDHEWEEVGEWLWNNKDCYSGIAVLPYFTGSYKQTPFEDCSKETYEHMMSLVTEIDLTEVIEEDDNTNLNDQVACSGGQCSV